ncbi:sugar ABC transporter permease [Phytoactinopolyspora alkaliphila]|uniref:Sugar ABC transporter permease n=1 Tax=Phytoactinopolyspora alkaliphila TaxID=1783498 RepID=A0A6N9YTT4_9ACTN|nr:sugar ABC transporter permease [Phytoactinopolyspora alkaliphila]NED98392.1 sugar ABC transporter permease [Phytoactinopolyspora alkaliphila]
MTLTGARDTPNAADTPPRQPRWRLSLSARNSFLSYALLAPSLALALVFIAFPIYMIVNLSLRDGRTMVMSEVGDLPFTLNNYTGVLTDPETWDSLRISAIYTTATVLGAIVVGMSTALLLRRRLPGRRWLRTLILIPWPIPGAIATVAFVWMLDGTYGVVNYLLRNLGIVDENIAWFFNPDTALIGVLMPTVWIAYPLCTLMLLASLQSVPEELYEAARVDGATPRQQFRHVTWPAVQNTAVLAMIVTGLWSFTTFDFIYAITRGGPDGATQTLAVAIYNQAFRFFDMPYAAALGVVTMAIASTVLLALFPVVRRRFF